ncbi:RE1-silencing transcription factor, partial [Bombina bombina]|uniref:RE1-silencing transcription factor n=1 Tax=Bombina bombina TaxID=8345 RepID=UPI00235A861D
CFDLFVGEKPFKCEQCSYVASNQHEVTRHARQVHNGPKPLTCPHCEYKTADRSNFKKHVELHVNPRQFMCPVCEYAASKKCNLQYHIKSRHLGCTAITMDVSNVKLRSKKGEVDGNACDENKPGLNDNLNLDGKEKQIDKIVHVEKKEKIRKGKKQVAVSFAGQVKTRSFRSSVRNKLKLANEKGSEKLSKDKHGKRINGISAKKIKRTDAGGAKIKKKKLVPRSKHSRVALKKEIKSVSSQKQKMCIQSKREIRDLKNKLRKKTSKRDCMSKCQGKQIILELGTDTDNQVKQQMILEHLAEMPDMINSSDNTQNSQDTPEIATGIVDILEQGPGENLPEDVPNNICVESSKCLVLSEKPKDSLTNKHTNRNGQNNEHIVNTKVNLTCKSQKEMDKPENNSKLGESIEPFQYLKQLSVESTEHSLYLGQVSMESAEPSKCLDELPVGSVKPSQCLGELPVKSAEPSQFLDELPVESAEPSQCLDELPVESAEPSQCLDELPVESAEPSQCLDELPVESAEPSQCLDELPVESAEPSQCLDELPVESAEPSQCLDELPVESAEPSRCLDGLSVEFTEPSPCLAELPVESAKPSQCLNELPVESAEPSPCLAQLPVESAEPSQCLDELPVESAEPSQCLDGLSVEFAEPSPCLAHLPVESAEPSQCLDGLSVEFAEPSPSLAELLVESAVPSPCLAELPVEFAEPCLAELPVDSAEPSLCLAELPVESTEPSLCLAELPVDSAEPSPCLAELPVEYAKPSPCLAELPVESAELSLCLAELPVESPERFQYTNKTTDSTKIQNPDKVPIENGYFFKPPSQSDSVSESVTDQTKNLHTLCEEQQRKYKTTKAKTLNINNNSKEILHSQSAFSSSNGETVDVEDDEGIHSHDGSDISDNISERSDDSGLNGMPSVQTKEIKAAELSLSSMETNISKDRYVCIFCDRSLKEVDYTKHLKRHLVNVYYLEKAANDQT